MAVFKKPDEKIIELLKRSGSRDRDEAFEAQHQLALAFEGSLRKGLLVGDTVGDIFTKMVIEPGATAEFPLDMLSPGTENEFVAFTNPGNGRIPERQVEGDYVMVPTYSIVSSIDWLLRYAREARYDIVARAMQILEASFTKKINDDAWRTLIAAGADRNILVYDADASAGVFTKRLVSTMRVVMRRNAGGNSASISRGKLTDLYVSPEAIEDIYNWNIDQIDDATRREIYLAPDEEVVRVLGVNIHALDELGEDQEYQDFFTDVLGGSLAAGDTELVVGLDLANADSFVMPIKEEVQIFPDDKLHRSQKAGFYGWMELGVAVLDNRRVLLGSL